MVKVIRGLPVASRPDSGGGGGDTVLDPYSTLLTPQQWGSLGAEIIALRGTPTLDAEGLHLGADVWAELLIPDAYRAGCAGFVMRFKPGSTAPDTNDYLTATLKLTAGAGDLTSYGILLNATAQDEISSLTGTPASPVYAPVSPTMSAHGGDAANAGGGFATVWLEPETAGFDVNANAGEVAVSGAEKQTSAGGTGWRVIDARPSPASVLVAYRGNSTPVPDSTWILTGLHLLRNLAAWSTP